jgi:hypothetical protein
MLGLGYHFTGDSRLINSTISLACLCLYVTTLINSASHTRAAPENVGLQKEQMCYTFAYYTCNEVRLCVLRIRKKEVGNTKR